MNAHSTSKNEVFEQLDAITHYRATATGHPGIGLLRDLATVLTQKENCFSHRT
jgi:hypothetical protein